MLHRNTNAAFGNANRLLLCLKWDSNLGLSQFEAEHVTLRQM